MPDAKDAEYFFNTLPGKVIHSKRINDAPSGRGIRILSEIVESAEEVKFTTDLNEITIRETPQGRSRIKATVFEDNRAIKVFTIQRYLRVGSSQVPHKEEHFSFVGEEITRLKKFLASIETISFDGNGKGRISDADLDGLIVGTLQARKLIDKNSEVFVQLMQNENWERDIVALGYRRNQLQNFEKLLNDREYFEAQRALIGGSAERVWQNFFEQNTWIFGYGLSYQFLSALDGRKLEQIVSGVSVSTVGKRIDGLLKTKGALEALCFVEIKTHESPLLKENFYRTGAWVPSEHLAGGVSQLQATVRAASKLLQEHFEAVDREGNPTGELLHNISPGSFLVVGKLSEFETENGPNLQKYASFEDYRRSLIRPTVLTFDELYERASYIVEHAE
ncbi:Shedu immune nuclease family protein [Hyphomonas sp. BRH_c22]|uniref:Shedu immune nuclease family protein n=1 Tax=Hyphomonas sp. BRH_c22 TaxID=1629710 RepID=UPI000A41DDB0|nr:Shedu immune nuclease family protein [Hyphomonas sp. BRH_c22]